MKKLKREDLQQLATVRLNEASLLLDHKKFSGAYYLTGLGIECALKACIARSTDQFEFPDLERVRDSWNHKLTELINTAGLQEALIKKNATDKLFEANWLTVKDWKINSRYELRAEKEAIDIYAAATEKVRGVMLWIEEHW